jgi:hypothetical protein
MIPQPTIDVLWPSTCNRLLLFDFGVNPCLQCPPDQGNSTAKDSRVGCPAALLYTRGSLIGTGHPGQVTSSASNIASPLARVGTAYACCARHAYCQNTDRSQVEFSLKFVPLSFFCCPKVDQPFLCSVRRWKQWSACLHCALHVVHTSVLVVAEAGSEVQRGYMPRAG